ncbi:hypothetical protein [Nitratireductor sp. PBL-C9]|uniref:hypothetical protein n=1 Tax=Nitratireductor sp. PBL-C9 TaxID=3435013 RepID=UPI003D7E05B9
MGNYVIAPVEYAFQLGSLAALAGEISVLLPQARGRGTNPFARRHPGSCDAATHLKLKRNSEETGKRPTKSTTEKSLVDPRGEELNRFFQTLEDWESHLAQHDLNGLECENEKIRKQ